MNKNVKWLVTAGLAITLTGCATAQKPGEPYNPDPYERFNRKMYGVNRAIDRNILKPVAQGYGAILPYFMQRGINNFFNNIRVIPTIANDILQLKWGYAWDDTGRLIINSTFGVLGFMDMAGHDIPAHYEDFGQTLASWGVERSPYLVLPLLGSTTVRDGIGSGVDYFVFSIWPHIDSDKTRYGLRAVDLIDNRAALLRSEKVVESAATDEYAFVRSAYLQRRDHEIRDGQLPDDDEFYDMEDFDE